MLNKKQKEKNRILKLKERVKQRGDAARDEKWVSFLDAWCDEVQIKIDKKEAEEKEKYLDYFMYRGKMFLFYNKDKDIKNEN